MKSNETLFMAMKFKPCQILILKSATIKVNDSFCLTLTTCWAEEYCTHIFAVSIYLIATIQLLMRDLNTVLYQFDSHLPQKCKTLNKGNICVQSYIEIKEIFFYIVFESSRWSIESSQVCNTLKNI